MGSSAIMPSKQQALNEANSAKSGEKTAVKQELAEPGAGMVPSPRAPDRDTRGPTRPYTSNPQTTTPGPPSQPGEGQDLQGCPRQGIPYTVQNGAPSPSEWPTAGVPPPTPQRLQHGPLPYLPQRQHPAGATQQPTRESPQAAGPMWQHPTILTSHSLSHPLCGLVRLPDLQEEVQCCGFCPPCSLLHPCSRSVGLAHSRCSPSGPVQASTSNTR